MRAGLLALAIVAIVGCVGGPADDDRRTVDLDGTPWVVLLATADGMRGRADFAGADGMLFDQGRDVDPESVFFVMDGVAFPLDIAWFAGDGRLVGTTTMPTCAASPCPRHASPGPFRWALEGPVGAFDDLAPDARLEVEAG